MSMPKSTRLSGGLSSPGCPNQGTTVDILSWNAHSITTDVKQLFIKSMPHDIICIQETWGSLNFNGFNHLFGCVSSGLSRPQERGGGSLTLFKRNIEIHSEYTINKDTKLLRAIVNCNKILWICNTYLNQGKINQIQKLFRLLRDKVPSSEWNRVVIIGDFNVNLNNPLDARVKLLEALAKELGLMILRPPLNTFKSSTLDFAIVSKKLEGLVSVSNRSISDHLPICLQIKLPFCNKNYNSISLPNRKLAEKISKEAIINAMSPQEWLSSHYYLSWKFDKKSLKKIKTVDYERKLFERLVCRKNTAIIDTIKKFWEELLCENERLRYSPEISEAFKQLKKIFKYDQFNSRDGSIVSSVLVNGEIINDPNSVNSLLISVLKHIQYNDSKPLPSNIPFRDLPTLSVEESLCLVQRMATNKALAFDLMSDVIFSKGLQTKTAQIITQLWQSELLNKLPPKYFEARLIPLNKKHPHTPTPEEFRPIVVMSPLVKLIEARLLSKLQSYLANGMSKCQIGFVPGMDVYVNIHRAVKQLRKRTNANQHAFCLFLDFKCL